MSTTSRRVRSWVASPSAGLARRAPMTRPARCSTCSAGPVPAPSRKPSTRQPTTPTHTCSDSATSYLSWRVLDAKWAKPAAAVVVQGMGMVERRGTQEHSVDRGEVPGEAGSHGQQVATETSTDPFRHQPELADLHIALRAPLHQDHADGVGTDPNDPAPHAGTRQQVQPLL